MHQLSDSELGHQLVVGLLRDMPIIPIIDGTYARYSIPVHWQN